MPISFKCAKCTDGQTIKAKEKLAGKRIKCPKCGEVIRVPQPASSSFEDQLAPLADPQDVEHPSDTPTADPFADLLPDNLAGDETPLDAGLPDFGSVQDDVQSDLSGFGGELPDFDSEVAPVSPAAVVPASSAASVAVSASKAKPRKRKASPPLGQRLKEVNSSEWLVFYGGGLAAGLILTLAIGIPWLSAGGDQDTTIATAANASSNERVAPAAGAEKATRTSPRGEVADRETAEAKGAEPSGRAASKATDQDASPASDEGSEMQQALAAYGVCEFDSPLTGFALDRKTGRLAIAGPWSDSVGLLTREQLRGGDTTVQALPVEGEPYSLTFAPYYERQVLVVGTSQPDALQFFDAESLEPMGMVDFTQGYPAIVSSSQQHPARIYVSLYKEKPHHWRSLGAAIVDVANMRSLGVWQKPTMKVISAAPDGSFVYNLSANSSEFPSIQRPPWDNMDDPRAQWKEDRNRYSSDERVHQYYAVDPQGRFVSIGKALMLPDLRTKIYDLKFHLQEFFQDAPWVAGMDVSDVVIGSINDGRVVAKLPLPEEWTAGKNGVTKISKGRVLADESGEQLVVVTPQHVVTIGLDQFDLPEEPILVPLSAPATEALVGEPYEFDAANSAGASQVELVAAPEGMQVDGTKVSWTPTAEQVADHLVRIRIGNDDVRHETAWRILAGHRKLKLPYFQAGFSVSPDESKIVVWSGDPRRTSPSTIIPGNTTISLLDLKTLEIIQEREISSPIRQMVFSEDHIYATGFEPGEQMTVAQLSPVDLSSRGKILIRSGTLSIVGNKYLVSVSDDQRQSTSYHLKNTRPVEDQPPQNNRSDSVRQPRRIGNSWLYDGVLWDESLRKRMLIIGRPGHYDNFDRHGSRMPAWPALQGCVTHLPFQVSNRYGGRQANQTRVLQHVPALIQVQRSGEQIKMALKSLSNQQPLGEWVVDSSYQNIHSSASETVAIASTNEQIICNFTGTTYLLALDAAALPEPFLFTPQQSKMTLHSMRKSRVKYVAGGARKYELELMRLGQFDPEKRLNSEDGEFILDISDLYASQVSVLATQYAPQKTRQTLEQFLAEKAAADRATYTRLTGEKSAGWPRRIECRVRAVNEKNELAVLRHYYFIDVSIADIKKFLANPNGFKETYLNRYRRSRPG